MVKKKHHFGTKLFIFLIIIVLIFVLVQLAKTFRGQGHNDLPIVKTDTPLVNMSVVTEVPLATTSKYITVTGSYPSFTIANDNFNFEIRDKVLAMQKDVEKSAQENWQGRYETSKDSTGPDKVAEFPDLSKDELSFAVNTNFVQVGEQYISIVVSIEGNTGGAHGFHNLLSFNYDVQAGKDITLADLFMQNSNPDTKYLKTLSDFSRKNLVEQWKANSVDNIDKEMLNSGTEPTVDNFDIFTFTPTEIKIYFDEYQVAPYVYGAQMVTWARV